MEKKPVFNAAERSMPDSFSFGVPNQKLAVAQIEGYYVRWINDIPGRLQLALQDGYSFVEKGECDIYEDITSMNNDDGNRIRKLVGQMPDGVSPLYAYLMKLPEEWKQKKESIIQSRIDAVEESINKGQYSLGNESSKSYVPANGIKIGR